MNAPSLLSIYTKGTFRKLQKMFGLELKDPYMKYKEIAIFKELFTKLKPKKCLEYGCGTSTLYFLDFLPKTHIGILLNIIKAGSKKFNL